MKQKGRERERERNGRMVKNATGEENKKKNMKNKKKKKNIKNGRSAINRARKMKQKLKLQTNIFDGEREDGGEGEEKFKNHPKLYLL